MIWHKSNTGHQGPPKALGNAQKWAVALGFTGLALFILAWCNLVTSDQVWWSALAMGFIFLGVVLFARASYLGAPWGVKNDGVWFKSISGRGFLAWATGAVLTGFYVVLYFYPQYLGLGQNGTNTGLIALFDPLSRGLNGHNASQWFVYGVLYTLAILAFGIKFLWKYRGNPYQKWRTISVMFFQTAFAFLIPELMARLNGNLPYTDLKNIWPLNYYNFEKYRVDAYINSGDIGIAILLFAIISILVITPILTYKYGKRWYCSWVCGCGGLAETAGDAFRQLGDTRRSVWKWERWTIHLVLVFVVLMTVAVIHSYLGDDPSRYGLTRTSFLIVVVALLALTFVWAVVFQGRQLARDAKIAGSIFFIAIIILIMAHLLGNEGPLFLIKTETLRKSYGFFIGSLFSGVIGVGFYPIFGNRVWCRFGCPMAAILGLQQRLFSRFRITVNGGQCISCGNCSTYCEMGIDVRAYAQKGVNIVRSSCVGCGICAAVCPRGVLRLENGPVADRTLDTDRVFGHVPDLLREARENT